MVHLDFRGFITYQYIFWFLKNILGNFLKDALRTLFSSICLLNAQGKCYSKEVIYRYGILSKKLLKIMVII